jgi:O-antigen/teichoic acid export membrane protein
MNDKKRILNSASSISISLFGIFSSFIIYPLINESIGNSGLCIWFFMVSISTFVVLADFGLSFSIVNKLIELNKNELKERSAIIYNSFLATIVISIVLMLTAILIMDIYLKNINDEKLKYLLINNKNNIIVFILLNFISLPINIIKKTYLALDKIHISNLLILLSNILLLIFIFLFYKFSNWSINQFIFFVNISIFVNIALVFTFFVLDKNIKFFANDKKIQFKIIKGLIIEGGLFSTMQVFAFFATGIDTFLLSSKSNIDQINSYGIYSKIAVILVISQHFQQYLWPNIGRLIFEKSFIEMKNIYKNIVIYSLCMVGFTSIFFYFCIDYIILKWIGKNFIPSNDIKLALSIWMLLSAYGGLASGFMNTKIFLYQHVIFYSISGTLALILKLLVLNDYGAAGLVWSTIVIFSLFYVIPTHIIILKIKN